MACITDARSASRPIDEMEYDIIVQGPNGNSRISRSIITKDVNPEDIFPSEFVFNAAVPENSIDENVAAPAATDVNVKTGWNIIKTLDIGPIPAAPAPSFSFKSIDREEIKARFDELQKKIEEKKLPAPSLPEIQAPSLPEIQAPPSIPINLPSIKPAPPAAAVPTSGKKPFEKIKDFISRPFEWKETITINQ